MRNIVIVMLFIWIETVNAQWIQTSLPGTSTIFCLAADSNRIFAGTYSCGVFLSGDYGSTWQDVNTGLPGTDVLSLAINDSGVFAGTCSGIYKSIDNGNQWSSSGFSGCWIYSLTCKGSKIYAGSDSGNVYFSTDNGSGWTTRGISTINVAVKTLAVSDSGIFAGTYQSGIFLSTDDGAEWTLVNSGSTFNDINSIVLNGPHIIAGGTGGVYVSTDNGRNWTAVNNGLTNIYVQALAVYGAYIFAGTHEEGVFYSTNNGAGWTAMNEGLTGWGNYITCLGVSDTNIFAGTDGAGLWRRPLSQFVLDVGHGNNQSVRDFMLQQNFPNPFNPNTTIRYFIPAAGNVSLIVYNSLGQTVKALFSGRKENGHYDVTWNGKDDNGRMVSSGIYIYKMQFGNQVKTGKMLLLK